MPKIEEPANVYDPENLFARMLRGEEPCVAVFDDDVALALMDAFPQSEGHTLVIPKNVDVTDFVSMPPRTVGPFVERVQHVARAIMSSLHPDGLCIMQLNGSAAGQTVPYPHFHLIPRWRGSGMLEHGSAPPAAPAQLEAAARRIRAALEI
jgi:histidine triad (HIT) family protein